MSVRLARPASVGPVVCLLLCCLWGAACSTPPAPSNACSSASDCKKGEDCLQGACVPKTQFPCDSDEYCAGVLASKDWTPNPAPGECQKAVCGAKKLCEVVSKAADTTCGDTDGLNCTIARCDGAGACQQESALAADVCHIGAACQAAGDLDPSNGCDACDPKASTSDWSHRAAATVCKDDGLGCTQDQCDGKGACQHSALKADTCRIQVGGTDTCFAKGDADPGNDCRTCDPAVSSFAWVPKQKGATCASDGLACTLDVCDGESVCDHSVLASETCLISGTCYKAGDAISDGCQVCQPAQDAKDWIKLPVDSACAKGAPCLLGSCDLGGKCIAAGTQKGWCYISADAKGACLQDGELDPKNACQRCDAAIAQDAWTPLPKTATCSADDIACTVDLCNGSGSCEAHPSDVLCAGSVSACAQGVCDTTTGCKSVPLSKDVTCVGSDGVACTIEHCDGASKCDNAGVPEHGLCDDGFACTLDLCGAGGCTHNSDPGYGGCDDGNVCTNDACDPGPSAAPNGCVHGANSVACDSDGLACTDDVCADMACKAGPIAAGACLIGGICQKSDDKSAAGCQVCDPSHSTSAWTVVSAGSSCTADSIGCTIDACDGKGACTHDAIDSTSCLIAGTCLSKGDVDAGNCQVCDPDKDQKAWTAVSAGTVCLPDAVTCTIDACDGKGACAHDQVQAGNCLIDGACQVKDELSAAGCLSCQPSVSQKAWSPVTLGVGCDSDGIACTIDACNGEGVCKHDQIAADTCLIGGQCHAKNDMIAAGCQACLPLKSQTAWSPLSAGSACDSDGVVCTVDQCDGSGVCDHSATAPGYCHIGAACVASGAAIEGGCQFCDPLKSVSAYTKKAAGGVCVVDAISCTDDRCDAGGLCKALANDAHCADSTTCTTHTCAPSDAKADATSGCVKVDNCPYGHVCNAAVNVNACITPSPVVLVTADVSNPAPTNPALIRHVLDAAKGTSRTWVTFQSQNCASVVSGGWKINQAAALRAVVLDPVAGDLKAQPPVVTLPKAAAWGSSATVCQGFPVVAKDPSAADRAWLGWLEADPGAATETAACLFGGSQGGVLRLARLDGAAVASGGGWSAAAGEVCSATGPTGPLFLTGGLAVHDAGSGLPANPSQTLMVGARPIGASLNTFGASQLMTLGTVNSAAPVQDNAISGNFSLIHPVTLDLVTPASDGTRFWSLGLTEKVSGVTTTRQLWALPVDAAGVDQTPVAWLTGTAVTTGPGSGDLKDITAVCALDAAVSDSGEIGVAMVVRRGGNDQILLARRSAAGAMTVDVIKEQGPSKGDCRHGLSAARVLAVGSSWVVTDITTSFLAPSTGKLSYTLIEQTTVTPHSLAAFDTMTTDTATGGSAPINPLAGRGLGGLVAGVNGVVTLVVEAGDGAGIHSVQVYTFKP